MGLSGLIAGGMSTEKVLAMKRDWAQRFFRASLWAIHMTTFFHSH